MSIDRPANTINSTNITDGTITAADLTTGLVSQLVPVGVLLPFVGTVAPTGYILCDGLSVSTTGTYAALFAIIGYTHGGSGSNFNLPDLRGRIPIGQNVVSLPNGKNATYSTRTLTNTGGAETNAGSIALNQASYSVAGHYHDIGAGAALTLANGTVGGSVGDGVPSNLNGAHTHTLADHNHNLPRANTGGGSKFWFSTAAQDPQTSGPVLDAASNPFTSGMYGGTTTNNTGSGHSHTFALQVTSGTVSGRVGLYTGGQSGNAAITATLSSNASIPSGNIDQMQPYIVTNYIIKY